MRGPSHGALCFWPSLVTCEPYIAAGVGARTPSGSYRVIMRHRNPDWLHESGTELPNHKALRFAPNSQSCALPRMVSHELGFISPWAGHIPGDPGTAPQQESWKYLPGHLDSAPKRTCLHPESLDEGVRLGRRTRLTQTQNLLSHHHPHSLHNRLPLSFWESLTLPISSMGMRLPPRAHP